MTRVNIILKVTAYRRFKRPNGSLPLVLTSKIIYSSLISYLDIIQKLNNPET